MTEYAGTGKYEIEEWMLAGEGCGHTGWHTMSFCHTKAQAVAEVERMEKDGRKARYIYSDSNTVEDEDV